jgi:excisionase family DNA binding protein
MDELITVDVKEAARITGLSRSKIYELIQDQDIVAKKLGRRTLLEVSVLKDYISQLPTFKSPSRNWGAADE